MIIRLWTIAAAALFLFGWASGKEWNQKMDEWLLPSGTLKAFAEYMPAYGKRALPGPDEREAARLEQAVDAARKAKEARALAEAAARLALRYGCPVLLKGGHLAGDCRDVLAGPAGRMKGEWTRPSVPDVSTHGTGCSLSAAIAARLAAGDGLVTAVERGLEFIAAAIRDHVRWVRPARVDALKLW